MLQSEKENVQGYTLYRLVLLHVLWNAIELEKFLLACVRPTTSAVSFVLSFFVGQ